MPTTYEDILYEIKDGVATITINRPDKYNAFRAQTCEELIHAFQQAGWDRSIGVIVLTGAGSKAFCTGGDQSAHVGHYDGRGVIGLPLEELQGVIRDVPKPVIAKVRGYAIGGGNVLALLCDLTLAAESAKFGQVGPKVGSVDTGFGTAYMARVIGEKRAREVWYLCRQYSAAEAVQMGLANKAVPDAELDAEVDLWCAEILEKSPTALTLAKRSFNADTAHIAGISALGLQAVSLFYGTEESQEGVRAFQEKRKPRFRAQKS
jgi:2-ketocyclohexanecarboxyl-CoA hydrolase